MFRNDYDTDVTTFSPAGRIHQVEYAIAAVKQGSACVALKSDDFAVLAAVSRKESELGSHQEKLFKVDDHLGIGISGLIADGRVLCKYLRTECLNHKFVFEGKMQTGRLVKNLSDKSQKYTQTSEKRPYGVGLLVIGYDKTGTHVFETLPSGNFFEYIAQAMGKRSQSSRTYLEKYFKEFKDMELGNLIEHALKSLKGASEETLTKNNCSVAYVGKGTKFTLLTGESLAPYMSLVDEEKKEAKKNED
ncbi:hypothetical protein AAMO2058_001044000 [Amorphochlora amoebiformis]|eukprot:497577-Amorphochlora_amoeboformis.AAC.1